MESVIVPLVLRAQALLMQKDIEYVFINADFCKQYRTAIREELFWTTFPIVVLVTEQKRASYWWLRPVERIPKKVIRLYLFIVIKWTENLQRGILCAGLQVTVFMKHMILILVGAAILLYSYGIIMEVSRG